MSRSSVAPLALGDIARLLAVGCPTGAAGIPVTGLTQDSRDVRPGDLFCCVPGERHDGHLLAPDAVAAGAVALIAEREIPDATVPVVRVPSVRAVLGPLAAAMLGEPASGMLTVGITGTNGKTSTAAMLAAILGAAGEKVVVLGTLSGERTTPEAIDLHARLRSARDEGATCLVMEVSSHGLAQHRTDGLVFDLAVLTNLGRDHLDFHRTQEAYFAAKARLFTPALTRRAVVNADDPHGRLLLDVAAVPTTGFSASDASDVGVAADSVSFTWRGLRVSVPVGGRFAVSNALAAASAAEALSIPVGTVVEGLSRVGGIRGRFESVPNDRDIDVIVDYAHTPEGLESLLRTAREVARGRVVVVFGCGGDRDEGKRPLMGEVAARLADAVVVTSDNPRSEDPLAIIGAVVEGTRRSGEPRAAVSVEPDRRSAIESAVRGARRGDMVVIAGKGHETVQEIAGTRLPFDDADAARRALADAGDGTSR